MEDLTRATETGPDHHHHVPHTGYIFDWWPGHEKKIILINAPLYIFNYPRELFSIKEWQRDQV